MISVDNDSLIFLKGTYYAKLTFTWCLIINVFAECVHNLAIMVKIQPLISSKFNMRHFLHTKYELQSDTFFTPPFD